MHYTYSARAFYLQCKSCLTWWSITSTALALQFSIHVGNKATVTGGKPGLIYSLSFLLLMITSCSCDKPPTWQAAHMTSHPCEMLSMWQAANVTSCQCDKSPMWQAVDYDKLPMWQAIDYDELPMWQAINYDELAMWQAVGYDELPMWQVVICVNNRRKTQGTSLSDWARE